MSSIERAAIFTGDLVNSRAAGAEAVDAAMDVLRDVAALLPPLTGGDTRFTRFRGDGWQMLVRDPRMALRAALIVLARMRAHSGPPTRLAVGFGAVTAPGRGDLGSGSGSAFVAAGEALERLGRRALMRAEGAPGALPPGEAAAFLLADIVARGWTAAQSQIAARLLAEPSLTQEALAGELGVTPQNVQKQVAAMELAEVEAALALLEGGRLDAR